MNHQPANDWHSQETYRSMIEFGRGMLRFLLIVNGGGILAILTFVGNLYTKAQCESVPNMVTPVVLFIIGIIFAGLATVTTYLVQFTLFNENMGRTESTWFNHVGWLKITLALITASILVFSIGAFVAVNQLHS